MQIFFYLCDKDLINKKPSLTLAQVPDPKREYGSSIFEIRKKNIFSFVVKTSFLQSNQMKLSSELYWSPIKKMSKPTFCFAILL